MGKLDRDAKEEMYEVENDCNEDEDLDESTNEEEEDQESTLKRQFEQLQEESNANLALAQRVQAEFDNFRKRNKNISAEYFDMGIGKLALEFLAVLDNLERALCSMDEGKCPEAFVEGIDMVTQQFKNVFEKFEIVEIEAMDMPFDPELHHAVAQEPIKEGQEKNTVVEVLQKGYMHKDKVLRYSMVKVVK